MDLKRVVVVDDHALTLDGVVQRLSAAEDMVVVGTANCGSDVMSLVRETQPDVAVLDVHMPGMDGLACLDLIRNKHPEVKVVMLSGFEDREHIEGALSRGATAYIVKTVSSVDLAAAVRQACDGTVFHPYRAPEPAKLPTEVAALTARERTILSALARGLSNKAISKELWVTEQTVKFHLNNVYRKLDVENRAAAVRWAFEHGVVEPDLQPA